MQKKENIHDSRVEDVLLKLVQTDSNTLDLIEEFIDKQANVNNKILENLFVLKKLLLLMSISLLLITIYVVWGYYSELISWVFNFISSLYKQISPDAKWQSIIVFPVSFILGRLSTRSSSKN